MLFREALGHTLRTVREQKKLSMRELQQRSYISLGYLSEVERGCNELSSDLMEVWAKALAVEPYELYLQAAYYLGGIEIPNSAEELAEYA